MLCEINCFYSMRYYELKWSDVNGKKEESNTSLNRWRKSIKEMLYIRHMS